jgi:hypothetical protein
VKDHERRCKHRRTIRRGNRLARDKFAIPNPDGEAGRGRFR